MQAISSHFKEVIIEREAIFVVLMVALLLPIALNLFVYVSGLEGAVSFSVKPGTK